MMYEEKLLTVARYLEGDMEPQEKQQFETLLQSDQELQDLLDAYKNIHQTLKMKIAPSQEDKDVEATLTSFGKQYFKQGAIPDTAKDAKVISLSSYMKWISVAAILIVGLFVWAPWNTDLYERYGISKEMSVVERGDGNKNNIEKAADLYNAGDFDAAGKILEKEYLADTANSLVAYYYGITLIETNKADEARRILIGLYAGKSVFKYEAAYYIGLSYLKQNNHAQALEWLEKIPQGSPVYEKAQELIKKIR
ncbi:tetratricopeptide (TPR) repeat protein [Pedobacter sp. AK017]|uniref:tetratricopeptide repeat protein n=1 Tax=Pedobacter sp. AK017 TaxID=2723073 RepID=UPI00161BDCFD|nr:tetratricopeptide repeat protein [Pedobacter sp. AK017]MBB5440540.1 tetratricopeptide (TPR) repeat protein [Pedobacter sp. AK017]